MKTLDERIESAIENYPELDVKMVGTVFTYLDDLRDSGVVNMFGARPYVMEVFDMQGSEAKDYLMAWMKTF